MANTFSQIYIQIVFAVKGRQCLIPKEHRENIHKYISGIVDNREQKMISIFCMPDHTHILVGIKPNGSISDLVRDIKAGSSKYISESNYVKGKFNWQDGFGAFSYSRSQVPAVANYIANQEDHHKKTTFREEYIDILRKLEIEYDEKYLFDFLE